MDLLPQAAEARPDIGRVNFREISRPADLHRLFRLRYLVYAREGYLEAAPHGLDIDSYDRHSRFMGAFAQNGDQNGDNGQSEEMMIGGARIILGEGEPNGAALDELLRQAGHPAPAPRPCAYAVQEQVDFSDVVCRSREAGRRLVEFGRLVIHPAWQGGKFGGHLVYALYGLALVNGIDMGVALIPPRLTDFYTRRGCHLLAGRGAANYMHTEAVAVLVDLRTLADGGREAIEAAAALRTAGCWTMPMRPRALPD